jgi:hypothetical protein
MADRDRDPVSLDDSNSPLRSDERTRRLCIVSSKPLLCRPFIAALRTVLTPHDELEIVVDRRRERVPTESRSDAAEQPSINRRRHPQVDRHLKIDGFAIVPAPAAGLKARRSPISLLLPEMPVEETWPEDLRDEERLDRARTFKRTHAGRLTTWLVLAGLMSAVLILFAPSSAVKTLMSRLRPEVSSSQSLPVPVPQDQQTGPEAHAPSVTANPAEVQRPGFPEASWPVRGEHSSSDAARELPAPAGASDTSAAARVPNPRATAPPRQIADVTTSPIAKTPPPDAVATRITSPRFAGLPRVEVVGTTAAAWGQGETYAVRVSDPAGRPLVGAEVFLLARMADSTVQSILLHSGPEPGTYQATVPGGSAPIDLRVAITMSDKRVEIPLSP